MRNLDVAISGLDNVTGIADDIYVYAENEQQHDIALTKLLNRLWENGVKLGADKIQYKLFKVDF